MASSALPGAFIPDLDLSLQPKLDTTNAVGSRSHFFQPPSTPSAASSLYRSASIDSSVMSSRKRARQDYASDEFATPIPANIGGWRFDVSPESIARSSGAMSPPPFVNTNYRLAGGLDTPTAAAAAAQEAREDGSRYSDVEYRRAWKGAGEKRAFGEDDYFPQASATGEQHQRYPSARYSGSQNGWSKAVLNVVGGVAGKVWEFCKTSAFRGFYAGGGAGYEMRTELNQNRLGRTVLEDSAWQDIDTNPSTTSISTFSHDFCSEADRFDRESTPIPGQFPEEDFIPDYISQCQRDASLPRPSKKILHDKGGGELKMSWVMVPPPPSSTTSSSTRTRARDITSTPSRTNPTRRVAAANASIGTSSGGKRKVIHPRTSLPATAVSLTSRPPAHKHSASFARAGSPLSTATSASVAAASYASPRSPSPSITPSIPKTPIQAEVERLAAKKRREEREADRSIRRFNDRLKAMIREGREALGTRFDVEDDIDGEDMEI